MDQNKVNRSINTIMVDVDDSILMWDNVKKKGKNKIMMMYAGKPHYLTPHIGHIDLIKHWHSQGYCIYIWSNNGPDWAAEAITKLQLWDYIYHVMNKPGKHIDDLDSDKILGSRVYLPFLEKK